MRLGLLRTSQMWFMPGGGQLYSGFQGYLRRCSVLYAGAAAALVVVYPLDVAYTCLAADAAAPRRFRGFIGFVRHAVGKHGARSLYRGFSLCLATAMPFVAISTAVHDALLPSLLQLRSRPAVHSGDHRAEDAGRANELERLLQERAPAQLFPWNLLLGAFSGFVAQSVTYPLDTVRRRWQHSLAGERADAPKSWHECAAALRRADGIRPFYAGFGFNSAKLVPELLVLCCVYRMVANSGSFV